MKKHAYSMFPVLSSPLNHTQTNQNKVMPSTYRTEFENKIKNMEIENNRNISNMFSGIIGAKRENISIQYIYNYNYQKVDSNSELYPLKTKTLNNNENKIINKNINRNLGWVGRENRFFSLSAMQNRGCGCG